MKSHTLFKSSALIFTLLVFAGGARAQEQDAPKFEIGIQYSSLSVNLPSFRGTENVASFGARATYNLTDYFALEAEGNVYPTGTQRDYVTGGASQQAQFGAKVGKRWKSFGLFGKARPGFVSFDSTLTPVRLESGGVSFIRFDRERKTHFALDVGGVLEFYPSRRMLVRFDAGDTIIRFGEHAELQSSGAAQSGAVGPAPAETTHSFQFTAGVGFRFGGGEVTGASMMQPSSRAHVRRFEAGIQFSSLLLSLSPERFGSVFFGPFDEGSQAEAGFGGRIGYNATDNLAFEAEGNFYPRKRFDFDNTTGGYPAQMQFGAKYGRRFERFGVFAKARPGFVTFSSVTTLTSTRTVTVGGQQFLVPTFDDRRRNYFSMDVGGVLEFYPTSRILTRFDLGDTIIRYGERDNATFITTTTSPRIPAETRHNLQFNAGIGLRF
ncbi:MAG: hypothetical protein QOE46_98 [Acidobacteriota bacterium]|jgi:hypothetical protein|nr:hypothetical protein [Acidobacteriota bacterium]